MRNKKLLIIILNLFIVLSTIFSIVVNINMRLNQGITPTFYRTFSFDSNIFMAIASVITIAYYIKTFNKDDINIPRWLAYINLGAAVSVLFTFLIVMVYLGPFIEGFGHMLSWQLIFLHLFNPIAVVLCFCVLEKEEKIELKKFYIGLIPMLLFGIIYIIFVYGLKTWPDIYRLNAGGLGFIIVPGMLILVSAISLGTIALRNLFACR